MHLLRSDQRSMDAAAEAVDLDQSPADVVILSFSASDLASVAQALKGDEFPFSVRLASLADLKHPFSVDLYADKVIDKARFVLVRLLGGLDYWRYGVDELAARARARGILLAVVPGDGRADARLDAASTVTALNREILWRCFQEGGSENMARALALVGSMLGRMAPPPPPRSLPASIDVPEARRTGTGDHALIVLYRSVLLAGDIAPIVALADALAQRDLNVSALAVTSLKDAAAIAGVRTALASEPPAIIINTTAFSARLDDGGSVLDEAGCPVLQAIMATCARAHWQESSRGLSSTDLAMMVAMPELDGRLSGGVISFKEEAAREERLEFAPHRHVADLGGISMLAERAAHWVRLSRKPNHDKRLALTLSDYPMKGGRTGYAVGLDTPQSVASITTELNQAGYDVTPLAAEGLMRALSEGEPQPTLRLEDYRRAFAALPPSLRAAITKQWGEPEADAMMRDGCFRHRFIQSGKLTVALQPPRAPTDQRENYHDTALPPAHGYVAFYLWLQQGLDALIHLGTHGTLEWLPGKAAALSEACAPQALTGALPVIYPFIVNNPGEAAQAKRRIGALTLGHLTPPLIIAGSHGALAELEALFDDYASALDLDPRRAGRLAGLILQKAEAQGLLRDSNASGSDDDKLAALDGWLCDIKEMRIGDGLHVFGGALDATTLDSQAQQLAEAGGVSAGEARARLAACGESETAALLAALSGRFVAPGPAGAPMRGRLDVLPTGRNLASLDPRVIPTRTAAELGALAAEALIARHLQDEGDYPKMVMLDLWGSAQLRTGGEDIAQALALMGVRPLWDHGSARVSGFEVLPLARLGRPRIDVSLRVSGLFRDLFAAQIMLFSEAARAVAAQDEDAADNPLKGAAQARVFSSAPGAYGTGVSNHLAGGTWSTRSDLGETYLAASSFAFDSGEAVAAPHAFRDRVEATDAFVHVQDIQGQDVLDGGAFAEHEGGFAAANAALGGKAKLYHTDAATPGALKVRTLAEAVARALHGRAANPRWIDGQMRHGYRGAAEIAEAVTQLHAFAALTDTVGDHHFEALFEATLGRDAVRGFLARDNPEALAAIVALYDDALKRGLWQARRNASLALLADLRNEPHG